MTYILNMWSFLFVNLLAAFVTVKKYWKFCARKITFRNFMFEKYLWMSSLQATTQFYIDVLIGTFKQY